MMGISLQIGSLARVLIADGLAEGVCLGIRVDISCGSRRRSSCNVFLRNLAIHTTDTCSPVSCDVTFDAHLILIHTKAFLVSLQRVIVSDDV